MIDWRKSLHGLGVALNLRDPPNVPSYGWSYFDHMVAVYVTLNSGDGRADALIKKSRETPDDLKWGDIFLLENIILSLQPAEIAERSAWIIRERFRETACTSLYEKYAQSGFPKETDTPAKLALLRADLTRVLDLLHWHYSLIPIRERIRKSLTLKCIVQVVIYTIVLGFLLVWFHKSSRDFLAMVSCVIYFGIIGGFVSSQRRMQNLPTDADPLVSIFGLDHAGYYLWLSPLLGAVFAVILTLMFIGGVLKGTVFPDFFGSQTDAPLSFFEFAGQTLPTSSAEWAKLFVWSFLAGFAERLVPDNLDRLGEKLGAINKQQSVGPSGPPPPPPPPGGPPHPRNPVGVPTREVSDEHVSKETLQDALHSGEIPPPHEASSET